MLCSGVCFSLTASVFTQIRPVFVIHDQFISEVSPVTLVLPCPCTCCIHIKQNGILYCACGIEIYSHNSMQTKNTTAMQWESEDKCLCIESYTYQHRALSPAFDLKEYDSTEFSTWTESRSAKLEIEWERIVL